MNGESVRRRISRYLRFSLYLSRSGLPTWQMNLQMTLLFPKNAK